MGKGFKKSDVPKEISSKKPFNPYEVKPKKKTPQSMDPRFDPLCGKFNEDLYRKSFTFINDLKQQELNELKERAKKMKNGEEKEALYQEIRKKTQQREQEQQRLRVREKVQEFRRTQRDLVKQGVNPFYLRRSDITKMKIEDQIQQAKNSGKSATKQLERRNKHLAAKQRKAIPQRRKKHED
ncbi:putative Ribosomal RNA processing protein 36 like protein [Blattamonas nauphoetae]|uniref:rRNA biogenesis protein RRP36 n=1 Tax=Blattamonas nauphoetae TaxID=2049346 RepID=A0ABQ9WLA2_9EUKA|nr:putative Ribosomal RNA processing protein 36 like protein [Blattamonas nauphoetae]